MADEPLYSERLIDALGVAARLHAGQRRKATAIPYLSHLLGTCSIALDYGAGEDEAIAALLHDAIEDVQPTADARAAVAEFGPEVLRIVEGCTDSDTHPKPPWQERKEAYIEHVADLDAPILLVSAADKLHNSRSIVSDLRRFGAETWNRFKGAAKGRSGTTARWSTPSAPTRPTRRSSWTSWIGRSPRWSRWPANG